MLISGIVSTDLAGRGKRVASVVLSELGGVSPGSIELRLGGGGGAILMRINVPVDGTAGFSFPAPLNFSNGGLFITASGDIRWSVDLI